MRVGMENLRVRVSVTRVRIRVGLILIVTLTLTFPIPHSRSAFRILLMPCYLQRSLLGLSFAFSSLFEVCHREHNNIAFHCT